MQVTSGGRYKGGEGKLTIAIDARARKRQGSRKGRMRREKGRVKRRRGRNGTKEEGKRRGNEKTLEGIGTMTEVG